MNREEKNALSRQRILEAALEEFSQKGYEAASLSNVCAVKLLFEKAGIPCFNVTGKYFGENHMWNIALLDGQWLWFDATSDRGSTGEFGFLRFGLTELDGAKYSWDQQQVQCLIG